MQTQRQEYINNVDYAPMLLVQLVEAADLGSHVAKKNIDTLINNYPLLCLNINNDLKRKMERMNIDTNDAGWEYVGRQTFTESQVSTADTKYKFVSVKDELDPNNIYQIRAKITYDVYRHIGDTSNLKYMYEIPIDIR